MGAKNIVVAGGGFGGFGTALNLEKKLRRDPSYRIVLIDQNTFHLYTASLYEVAIGELSSQCVLLPFHRSVKGRKIEFVNATITEIDPIKKLIKTASGDLISYWKMIFALGADTEDFGIPGVARYGLGLKSVTDAEKIRQRLAHGAATKNQPIKVIVGGGGFTGIEIAGELTGYRDFPIEVTVVEAAPRILAGLPELVSKTVTHRLNLLGVKIATSSPIKEAKPDRITLANGREMPYDVLIWTAGVRGSRLLDPNIFPLDKRKALIVDRYLRVQGFEDIFVIGDNAATGVAWTATKAEADGKIAAHNITAGIKGKKMESYRAFEPSFIIPVGKNWAIAKIGKIIFWGRAVALLKDLVRLSYLLKIMPFWAALPSWWRGEREVLEIRPPSLR